MGIKKLLFVCSGNSCRSVMAEYMMKDLCKKYNLKIDIFSRGIEPEEEVSPYTIDVLKNAEVKKRTPIQLKQKDISLSDLVLTMDKEVKAKIILSYPNISENLEKVYTLKEILGYGDSNIKDPYEIRFIVRKGKKHKNMDERQIIDTYKNCNKEILTCLKKLIKKRGKLVLPKNNFSEIVEYYINKIKEKDLRNG